MDSVFRPRGTHVVGNFIFIQPIHNVPRFCSAGIHLKYFDDEGRGLLVYDVIHILVDLVTVVNRAAEILAFFRADGLTALYLLTKFF